MRNSTIRNTITSHANGATVADDVLTTFRGTIGSQFAEFVIVGGPPTAPEAHMIYLIKGEDGIWRIDSM